MLPPEETLEAEGFPYPLVDSMRVLGVQLDTYGSLDDQLLVILARAQVRQGLLARAAHSSWGLETDVLRVTRDALIVSLLRYGLVVVGSCVPDDLMTRMDVHIVDTASRRITGLPVFLRVEALHFLAQTQSMRNLYIRHCAEFLHAVMGSNGSGIKKRIEAELCAIFQVETLQPKVVPLKADFQASYLYHSD